MSGGQRLSGGVVIPWKDGEEVSPETTALQRGSELLHSPRRVECLRHAGLLEPLGHDVLATALHRTTADRQPHAPVSGIVLAPAVVLKAVDLALDRVALGAPQWTVTQILQLADQRVDRAVPEYLSPGPVLFPAVLAAVRAPAVRG